MEHRLYFFNNTVYNLKNRLGFEHEHSRSDRDQNIHVLINNTDEYRQFERGSRVHETELEAPYDFHSIVHYTSYQGQNSIFRPVILSKIPVLVSDINEIKHEREMLTPIDIYKIQRFYSCTTIPVPSIVKEDEATIDMDKLDVVLKRFNK
jgi:hypothetical protein